MLLTLNQVFHPQRAARGIDDPQNLDGLRFEPENDAQSATLPTEDQFPHFEAECIGFRNPSAMQRKSIETLDGSHQPRIPRPECVRCDLSHPSDE